MTKNTETRSQFSRRDFIRKLAYVPPAIASLTVLPAFHASGSGLTGTSSNRDTDWGGNHTRHRR